MCDFAHDLEALSLLLHGVGVVAEAIDHKACGLNFAGLSCALALYEDALGADAGTCRDVLQQLLVELCGVDKNLVSRESMMLVLSMAIKRIFLASCKAIINLLSSSTDTSRESSSVLTI